MNEDALAAVASGFHSAAIGEHSFDQPLDAMIDLLGMRSGQLVAFGSQSLIPLNIMTRMEDEAAREFVAVDGGNPVVNSKVRSGMLHGELVVLDEADFDTAGDRARTPEFASWMDRHDIGYCCVSTLIRTPDTLVGIASLQSANGPALDKAGKRAFGQIATAARSAVVLREAIEGHGLKLLTPALECVGLAVFIYDIAGRIRAMTPSAEQLIARQNFGRIVAGRFVPRDPVSQSAFQDRLQRTIQCWATPHAEGTKPCVLRGADGAQIAVEFVPMPAVHDFAFAAAAMVILKVPTDRASRSAELATALFGFTPTERRIANLLLEGSSPQMIATVTNTSVGTIRNHIHRILSKAECTSQVQFLALMNKLI